MSDKMLAKDLDLIAGVLTTKLMEAEEAMPRDVRDGIVLINKAYLEDAIELMKKASNEISPWPRIDIVKNCYDGTWAVKANSVLCATCIKSFHAARAIGDIFQEDS